MELIINYITLALAFCGIGMSIYSLKHKEVGDWFILVCFALNCLFCGVNIGLCIAKWFLL